jgi:hypothetical protein
MTVLYNGYTYDLPAPEVDFVRLDAMRKAIKRRASEREYLAVREIVLTILMNNHDEQAFAMIEELFCNTIRDLDGRDEAQAATWMRWGL